MSGYNPARAAETHRDLVELSQTEFGQRLINNMIKAADNVVDIRIRLRKAKARREALIVA